MKDNKIDSKNNLQQMKIITREYVMTRRGDHIFSCLLNNGKAIEIHNDPVTEESILGNIYIGRIQKIASNIGAAFLEIAPGRVCHVQLADLEGAFYTKKGASKLPQQGDELIVQVVREEIKLKRPSVSSKISLQGKYAVLTTDSRSGISVSKKLKQEDRDRLKTWAEEIVADEMTAQTNENKPPADGRGAQMKMSCKHDARLAASTPGGVLESQDNIRTSAQDYDYGFIIRTNAASISQTELSNELASLMESYASIRTRAQHATAFTCLSQTPPAYLTRLNNLYTTEVQKIITDDPELYSSILPFINHAKVKDAKEKDAMAKDAIAKDVDTNTPQIEVKLYQDHMITLDKLYNLERELKEALSERVWLRSGGFLVIQPTEALTVIDVNTGKAEGGKDKEKVYLKINQEAATEIGRQMRLRNLSGIIIVDFINMEQEESQKQLMSELTGILHKDPISTRVVDITKLGLVEITRKKIEKPLADII